MFFLFKPEHLFLVPAWGICLVFGGKLVVSVLVRMRMRSLGLRMTQGKFLSLEVGQGLKGDRFWVEAKKPNETAKDWRIRFYLAINRLLDWTVYLVVI